MEHEPSNTEPEIREKLMSSAVARIGSAVLRLPDLDPVAAERAGRAAETREVLDTGWFAMLEATFPNSVKVHPGMAQAVRAALPGRAPGVVLGDHVVDIHVGLRASSLAEDPVAEQAIGDLHHSVLTGATLRLSIYHDDMRAGAGGRPRFESLRGDPKA